jgi:hypothetical protein
MAYIFLILASFCCTLAAFWTPNRQPGPWYGQLHIGWLGMAFYFWSLVFLHAHIGG